MDVAFLSRLQFAVTAAFHYIYPPLSNGLFALVGVGMFPTLVRAADPARSLTVYNAASSTTSLTIMLIIAAIGIPFVLACTIGIYWIFRGKVKLDSMSY